MHGSFALQVAKGKWNKNKKYARRVEDNIRKAQKRGMGPAIPMSKFGPVAIGCLKSVSENLDKIAPDALLALRTAAEASFHYNLETVRDREASLFRSLLSCTESEVSEWHRGGIESCRVPVVVSIPCPQAVAVDMLSAVQGMASHRKKVAPAEEDFGALSVAAEFLNPSLQRVMIDNLDKKRRVTLPQPKNPQRFHKKVKW